MKNVFKMLGIALVACTMLVACGDDTETFTIKVKANPADAGTVTGGGKYDSGATATLEAVANAGYTFVDWEDGSKNNPRIVTVTADAEYTANFKVQSGVKVQFGDATWNAEEIYALTNSQVYQLSVAQSSTNNYPFALLYSSSMATGSTNATCSIDVTAQTCEVGDPYMWYYDEQPLFSVDGDGAASWWADNLTVNVSAVDPDAMTISLVANGTALHVTELFEGTSWSNLTSKPMTMTATNVELTSAKGIKAVKSGKIVKL